jgi:hypothetical protein
MFGAGARRFAASRVSLVLGLAIASAVACGQNAGSNAGAEAGSDGPVFASLADAGTMAIVVTPSGSMVTVVSGQPAPTVSFHAQLNGAPVAVMWQVDHPEIGTIDAHGVFTPTGSVGGVVTVTATSGGASGTTTITVVIHAVQNGSAQVDAGSGAGGFGGVGGEGLGPAVSAGTQTVLQGPATPSSLKLLYPYDQTVWPLGILAPLLQWTDTSSPADGVSIHLSGAYYDYKGVFGRPTALAAGAPFVRHPIPEDVWSAATRSTAGAQLTVELVVAAGGTAYGPMRATWTMSKAQVTGTIYYQSYGTKLVENLGGAMGGDGRFGGATLAIRVDSTDPVLVAGKTTADQTGCRVCHSVSALGNRMVVQHGDAYQTSSSYDLNKGFAETVYPPATDGKLGWVGLYPDGTIGLGNSRALSGAESTVGAVLYDMATGNAMPTNGLTSFVTSTALPSFSPDGKHVAFNFDQGPGTAATGPGNEQKLATMDFDRASATFSNPVLLANGAGGGRPGWSTFLPGGEGVIFEVQTAGSYFQTRYGSKAELWWVDFATKKPTRLDRVNGKANGAIYIPTGPNNHDDDTVLNYDPSLAPIVSGGYAWLIFMSRRLYGNTATIDPWFSDPREHDLTQTPTTKKLWATAIDLNPQPGTDPSHPAFYIPGQEILAGNARPFWVLDACVGADGKPCTLGSPVCSQQGGKCQVAIDCCDGKGLSCINQQCTTQIVQ